jgi:hypothetical protein
MQNVGHFEVCTSEVKTFKSVLSVTTKSDQSNIPHICKLDHTKSSNICSTNQPRGTEKLTFNLNTSAVNKVVALKTCKKTYGCKVGTVKLI